MCSLFFEISLTLVGFSLMGKTLCEVNLQCFCGRRGKIQAVKGPSPLQCHKSGGTHGGDPHF